MKDCIFCDIIDKAIHSEVLYRDDEFIIINDINPVAKIHLLAIPLIHYPDLSSQTEEGMLTLSHILNKIALKASEFGLDNGYRLVINQGEDAGQTVKHLHIHIIGGEKLKD